jgi:hypothetical protein
VVPRSSGHCVVSSLVTASCLMPHDSGLLPLAFCLLPLASRLLPLASCFLPSCLLPPCLLPPCLPCSMLYPLTSLLSQKPSYRRPENEVYEDGETVEWCSACYHASAQDPRAFVGRVAGGMWLCLRLWNTDCMDMLCLCSPLFSSVLLCSPLLASVRMLRSISKTRFLAHHPCTTLVTPL